VITFKGSSKSTPVLDISERLTGRRYGPDARYELMIRLLREHGDVSISSVNSYVETTEMSDIVEMFGSWFWNDYEERAVRQTLLHQIVRCEFEDNGAFRIPTPH
jgi:hypothetical protein